MKPEQPRPDAEAGEQLTAPEDDRHEYDGITEYDNPMPAWWRRIFWATFVFSIGYYVHYQLTGNGESVEQSYAVAMREHRELLASEAMGQELTEEGLAQLMVDPALMKDARTVFSARCAQCHADRGQGNIGPNLTDDHWIYGSASLLDVHEIVANGRPQKGMPGWARQLRPLELAQVVAYVGTLRSTHVPGRPPQGTRLVARAAGAEAAEAAEAAGADKAKAQSAPRVASGGS